MCCTCLGLPSARCQASASTEVAATIERNSYMLINKIKEQAAMNEVLAKDNARLKGELTQTQSESRCVSCRDAQKSEEFVPFDCGHVCVCRACYDHFARVSGANSVVCPACREEVRFTMRLANQGGR